MKNDNYVYLVSGVTLWSLVILKASGAVDISWLWVFAPIWLPIVLVMCAALPCMLFIFISEVLNEYIKHYKE